MRDFSRIICNPGPYLQHFLQCFVENNVETRLHMIPLIEEILVPFFFHDAAVPTSPIIYFILNFLWILEGFTKC